MPTAPRRAPASRWRRTATRALIGLAAAAACAAAAWAVVVPSGWLAHQVRQAVVSHLAASLDRRVALGGVGGNLLAGVDLRDLVIAERGGFSRGVMFSVDRVHLAFSLAALARHPSRVLDAVARADLLRPRLAVARNARGVWNLGDILAQPESPLATGGNTRVTVREGILTYADSLGVPTPPFATRFLHVDGTIDSGPDRIDAHLAGRSPDGEAASLAGRFLPRSDSYDFDVTVQDGRVRRWGGYLLRLSEIRWDEGRFDGRVHFVGTPSGQALALDYTASLRITDGEAEYLPAHTPLHAITGLFTLDSGHAASDGISLRAGTSPLWVRGAVAYAGGPWLDLAVRSPGLDLARVHALFFPRAAVGLTGQASGDVWITGPAGAPYLSGDVTDARGRVNRQAFTGLRTRFEYGGGVLALDGLSAALGGGTVSGRATLTLSASEPSYTIAAVADRLDLAVLPAAGLPVTRGLAGRGSGTVIAVGTGGHARLLADIALERGTLRGQTFDDLRAWLWDDDGALDLDALEAHVGPTTLYASGRIGAGGALSLGLEAHDLPLAQVGARTALGAGRLSGWAQFDGRLTGSLESPVLSGTAAAWDGHLGPVPFRFARGDITLSPRTVSSRGLEVFDGAAQYDASGTLDTERLTARGLVVEARDVSVQPLLRTTLGFADAAGTISGRLRLDGPLDRPQIAGRVILQNGRVLGQQVDTAEVTVAGGGAGPIQVLGLDARTNEATLHAAGTVDPRGRVDLAIQARNVRLADVNAAARLGVLPRGSLSATGRVVGTIGDPEFQGTFASSGLSIRGEAFQAGGTVDYRRDLLRLAPLDLTQGDAHYHLTGAVYLAGRPEADLTLDVDHGEIATLVHAAGLALPMPLAGTLDGRVSLAGPLDDPSAHLTLAIRDARVAGVPAGTGSADLLLSHGAVTINRFDLTPPRGRLTAQGHLTVGGTTEVELAAQDLDPNLLAPVFRLSEPLVGTLNFTLQLSGQTSNPVAGLSFDARNAGVPGAVADRIVALAFYKDGTLHIEDGLIVKGPHKLVAQGTLPLNPEGLALDPRGPVALQFRLDDADLSFLSLLTPSVHDAAGTVAGEVTVGGTAGRPEMTGYLRTSGGSLRIDGLAQRIQGLDADLAFSQDQIEIRHVTANIGGGTAEVHGKVAVSGFRAETLALSLTARGAGVTIPGLYTGTVDASLGLTGPAQRPVLAGAVTLSDGRVTVASAPGRPGAAPLPIDLDVSVEAGQRVTYAAGAVQVPIGGTVHVGGTLSQPRLSGHIRSLGGAFTLLGTQFTLVQGEATFAEALGLEPQIAARAQAQVGDIRIYLDVIGVAPNPTVVWTSDPPLGQSDIMALVFGTAGSGGAGFGEAVAGQELGRLLIGSFTQALQRVLRLDEFSISGSPQSPISLRIGKFVLRDLFLSLTRVMPRSDSGSITPATLAATGVYTRPANSSQGYTVFGSEYFLSPNVSLTYNVDTIGNNGMFVLTRWPF